MVYTRASAPASYDDFESEREDMGDQPDMLELGGDPYEV
jgi:hypothetical protein